VSSFPFPIPVCAICHRVVERMDFDYDFTGQYYILEVMCHGQTETMRMDKFDKQHIVAPGMAFAKTLTPLPIVTNVMLVSGPEESL
jgi:hypothetical protein